MDKKIIAITGPSGAGKTTLGDNICKHNSVLIPKHCTTRIPRNDDAPGFYRYLIHSEYKKLVDDDKFLITSGDGPIVDKKYGNFYGVLKDDCEEAFNINSKIILFVSYKDIEKLIEINNNGQYSIDILNLTFYDIENGIRMRIQNNKQRNHTIDEVEKRIKCAIDYQKEYGQVLDKYAHTIYTDYEGIEDTYKCACKILKL